MFLNATNAAYNTNLTFPDDTTDYGVGPSVEAYTCRIVLCTSSILQNANYWMVPLATYAGGNALTDDREFCVYATETSDRTRQTWAPCLSAYNNTDGVDIAPQEGGAYLPDSKLAEAYGTWHVPSSFVSDLTITPVVIPYAGGNIYGRSRSYHGACTELSGQHYTVGSWSANAGVAYRNVCQWEHPIAPSAGDLILLRWQRDATNPLDTVSASVHVKGWIIEYTASY
jgi:hypothetical protein